jgi:molybdenum cofactor biosynthesis enzyme MoaA
MISFGQGCEGEPLTRAHHIARAIRLIRERTSRGSININTNGSRPKAMQLLVEAGLDACRVSLNSARTELYEAYYRPVDYGLEEVRETLRIARDGGLYIALNLLTFPGVTDRSGEVDALERLIAEFGVHQVQTRNLALDPEQYLALARQHADRSPSIGIPSMIRRLRRSRPGLMIGNFARGLSERPGWTRPRHPVQTATA